MERTTFPVLEDCAASQHDTSLSPFMVSLDRGFLPRVDPPATLPKEFDALEALLNRMPISTADGSPGLLAEGKLGDAVLKELPDLTSEVDKFKDDLIVVTALYRDYSFLASAYLLEPCHLRHVRGEPYGLARQVLPAAIACPLARVAEMAGFSPFMEYAGSYALYNYRLHEESRGLEYDNLRLVRAFELGVADQSSSEAGFVLVHVAMVNHSGALVEGTMQALQGCADDDRDAFNAGLEKVVIAMKEINLTMNDMWKRSKPNQYTNFRTFIFGITNQTMFPNGVVYEGIDTEPKAFRGESGANDSMIPLCDNLLQISMPETPLTKILEDFRSYRPGNHRMFLEWVRDRSQSVGLKDYALVQAQSAALYLKALNQVRDFRWRHWSFTREYILKQTAHPTATGGSPIVTWLPNQLQAVLDSMLDVARRFTSTGGILQLPHCSEIVELAQSQDHALEKEVHKYRLDRGV